MTPPAFVLRLLAPPKPEGRMHGLLAEFRTVPALFHACEQVRDAGFTRWDAHTPFPIHGIDKAMGLKRSPLPWLVLASALAFAAGGFALQTWVHSIEYPLVISGKPFFTWPAYVPVTFELGVLGGALAAVFGMLGLNRLSMHNHPLFTSERFERATDDRFFISIEAADPKFDAAATADLLTKAGANVVEQVIA
jgi:hypothetical protein